VDLDTASQRWSGVMAESDATQFRNHAELCRAMAARAISEPEKESWLRLAADWIKLAEETDRRWPKS
jgi:hypothetical protein